MDTLRHYHYLMTQLLLMVMILNLILPYILSSDAVRRVFYTRVGYFAFWASWAMVLFSGLILFVFMKNPMTPVVISMLILSVVLPIMDGYRAVRLGKIWRDGGEGIPFSASVVLAELAMVVSVVVYARM